MLPIVKGRIDWFLLLPRQSKLKQTQLEFEFILTIRLTHQYHINVAYLLTNNMLVMVNFWLCNRQEKYKKQSTPNIGPCVIYFLCLVTEAMTI